jgi:hypothetical protein
MNRKLMASIEEIRPGQPQRRSERLAAIEKTINGLCRNRRAETTGTEKNTKAQFDSKEETDLLVPTYS